MRKIRPYHLRCTYFVYKHALSLAEPGKEKEITTNKLTTMCLKYGRFQPKRA